MKMLGAIYNDGRKELVSVVTDEEGNPRVDTLKPSDAGEDWVPPTLVPVVKVAAPEYDEAVERIEPSIVWFDDRAERQWQVIALSAKQIACRARATQRAQIISTWNSLPVWLRGPFQEKFIAANALVDELDDEAAAALIEYADAPTAYTSEQLDTFNTTKASLKAAIENLPQP
jgi:hypothetical protein